MTRVDSSCLSFSDHGPRHYAWGLPETGSPLSLSSASMTFHLPTRFSLSMGVSLLGSILTFGRLASVSFFIRTSARDFGFGLSVLRWWTRIDRSVFALPMTGSGIRCPVSWVMRFMSCDDFVSGVLTSTGRLNLLRKRIHYLVVGLVLKSLCRGLCSMLELGLGACCYPMYHPLSVWL